MASWNSQNNNDDFLSKNRQQNSKQNLNGNKYDYKKNNSSSNVLPIVIVVLSVAVLVIAAIFYFNPLGNKEKSSTTEVSQSQQQEKQGNKGYDVNSFSDEYNSYSNGDCQSKYVSSGVELKSDVYLVDNKYIVCLFSYPNPEINQNVYESVTGILKYSDDNKDYSSNYEYVLSGSYSSFAGTDDALADIISLNDSYYSREAYGQVEHNKNISTPLLNVVTCYGDYDLNQKNDFKIEIKDQNYNTTQTINNIKMKSVTKSEMTQKIYEWTDQYGLCRNYSY